MLYITVVGGTTGISQTKVATLVLNTLVGVGADDGHGNAVPRVGVVMALLMALMDNNSLWLVLFV